MRKLRHPTKLYLLKRLVIVIKKVIIIRRAVPFKTPQYMLHSFHGHIYGDVFLERRVCIGISAVRDPKKLSAGIQRIYPLYGSGKKSLGIIDNDIAVPFFQADQLFLAQHTVIVYDIDGLVGFCSDVQQRKKRSVDPVFLKGDPFAFQHKPYRVAQKKGR